MSHPQSPAPSEQPRTAPAPAPAPPVVVVQQAQAMRGPNHVLHFFLSCLTFGLWLPVWFFIALGNRQRPV